MDRCCKMNHGVESKTGTHDVVYVRLVVRVGVWTCPVVRVGCYTTVATAIPGLPLACYRRMLSAGSWGLARCGGLVAWVVPEHSDDASCMQYGICSMLKLKCTRVIMHTAPGCSVSVSDNQIRSCVGYSGHPHRTQQRYEMGGLRGQI
jgi:hypothetical protein